MFALDDHGTYRLEKRVTAEAPDEVDLGAGHLLLDLGALLA